MTNNNFIVGIASRTYDAAGAVVLKPDTQGTTLRGGERRLTRTKTLDGGVVITDGGVAAGDKTLELRITSDRTLWQTLRALSEDALWVTVSTDEACYLAKIERISESDGQIKMTIMVKEDLSEDE